MRIFITGSSGFLGRQITECALASGLEVVGLRRSGAGFEELKHPNLSWLIGDLQSVRREDLTGIDCFIHAAASGVMKKESLSSLLEVNFHQSIDLLKRAIDSGIPKFVVIGSWFEYGNACERYEAIPADAPLLPLCEYGISKAAFGIAALGLARLQNVDMTLARVFHLYGDREPPHRFWKSLYSAASSGADFPMTKGEQIRDFVHVDVAAKKILEHIQNDQIEKVANKIVNVGSGYGTSLIDFANEWWKRWDAKGKILSGVLPYRKNEIMRCVADTTLNIESLSSFNSQ
jgi:nucleoside-diphosphate-sugar epimerase